MREIILSNGKGVAIVDDDDFEYLNQFKWNFHKGNSTDYASRHLIINGKTQHNKILMHRDIMKPDDGLQVDHINHNGLDNRRCNLRVVNNRDNHHNLVTKNKHGFIGVKKHYHRYAAQIRIGKDMVYLGMHSTPEDAHNAYMNAYNNLQNREI